MSYPQSVLRFNIQPREILKNKLKAMLPLGQENGTRALKYALLILTSQTLQLSILLNTSRRRDWPRISSAPPSTQHGSAASAHQPGTPGASGSLLPEPTSPEACWQHLSLTQNSKFSCCSYCCVLPFLPLSLFACFLFSMTPRPLYLVLPFICCFRMSSCPLDVLQEQWPS